MIETPIDLNVIKARLGSVTGRRCLDTTRGADSVMKLLKIDMPAMINEIECLRADLAICHNEVAAPLEAIRLKREKKQMSKGDEVIRD